MFPAMMSIITAWENIKGGNLLLQWMACLPEALPNAA
jgi:hypothetical protein